MKELKKLKLSKFTSELQKGQMRKLMGGASTDSFGYMTSQTKQDKDDSSGDRDVASLPIEFMKNLL